MSTVDLHLFPNPLGRDLAAKSLALTTGCAAGVPYYTVEEYIDRCLEEVGEFRPLVGGGLRRLLVGRAVGDALGKTATPGLVEEYARALAELKEAGIAPETLSAAGAGSEPGGGPSRLARIYKSYEAQLRAAGVQDREGLDLCLFEWLDRHAGGPFPPALSSLRSVTLHDLFSYSPVVCGVLSRVIAIAPEGGTVISFTGSANVDATRFAEYTWQRFVEDERLADHVLPEFARPRRRGGNLEAIGERLFRGGHVSRELCADGSLQILRAQGRYEEVEEIGWQIRGLLDDGVPMTEIAVLIRNWELYGEFLEDVLRRYGIPGHFRLGPPLFSVPLVKALFSFLRIGDRAWRREDFLALLTSEYFRAPMEPGVEAEGILNRVRYIDAQLAPLDRLLGAPGAGHFPPHLREECRGLRSRVRKMQRLHKALVSTERTFLGHVEALMKVLTQLGLPDRLDLREGVPVRIAQREQEAIRILLESLRQAGVLLERLGEGRRPFAEFIHSAVDLLQDRTLPAPQTWTEGIAILGIRDVVGLRYQAVFLPGLVDGEIPRPYRENPVFLDGEKVRLNGVLKRGPLRDRLPGLPLLTSKDRGREEPLLFFAALEACDGRCVLSHPGRDAEGEPLFPSSFIDEVLWHFRLEEDASPCRTARGGIIKPLASSLSRDELVRAAARVWARGNFPALDDLLEREGVPVSRLKETVRVERNRGPFLSGTGDREGPEFYGDLGAAGRGVPRDHPWTPTALQSLASCPFVFFAQFALGLEPREARGRDLDAREIGALVHEILRLFYAGGKEGSGPELRAALQSAARRVMGTWEEGGTVGDPGYWRLRCREIAAALDEYALFLISAEADGEWKTLWLEESLGPRSFRTADPVVLTGRADRVAVRKEDDAVAEIRVEDFKYSVLSPAYKNLVQEESVGTVSFQLPVYALLARERLRAEKIPLVRDPLLSARYILLRDPARKVLGLRLGDDLLDPEGGPLFRGIASLVDKAARGAFHPAPLDPGVCDRCQFRVLCRFWSSGAADAVLLDRDMDGNGDA